MLAEVVRNGRVEAVHEGVVAIVDRDGRLVASSGDVDRPFFARSALKPFQALVSQRHGADLAGEALALACGSHAGLPEHLAIERRMLAEAFIRNEQREALLLTCNAEQRYQWLLQHEPHLLDRVAQFHLASYLGVDAVTLSRLKKKFRPQ